jgi:MOSC domain-containing protein YiiM
MDRIVRSINELDRLWKALPPLPRERGRVELIVVRPTSGVRETPERVDISPELGVHGDRWSKAAAADPDKQVTLMNARVAEVVAGTPGTGIPWELFGDNFLVDIDLSEDALPVGTTLALGGAIVQITALPHTGCKNYRQRFGSQALRWINHKNNRPQKLRGVNCRVIQAGTVALGDLIEVMARVPEP